MCIGCIHGPATRRELGGVREACQGDLQSCLVQDLFLTLVVAAVDQSQFEQVVKRRAWRMVPQLIRWFAIIRVLIFIAHALEIEHECHTICRHIVPVFRPHWLHFQAFDIEPRPPHRVDKLQKRIGPGLWHCSRCGRIRLVGRQLDSLRHH